MNLLKVLRKENIFRASVQQYDSLDKQTDQLTRLIFSII